MSHAAGAPGPTGPAPGSLRDRLLDAASETTCERGWTAVTMGKLAERVGVSRQTVYNELGSKPALGQALVLRELDRFLAVVAEELDGADDVVPAIRSASERLLVMAEGNPLLRAVLSSAHSGTSELLPYLTTHAEPLMQAATAMLAERLPARFPDLGLDDAELAVAVDTIVRLVLSHVMQPGRPAAETADDIAWVSERLLRR